MDPFRIQRAFRFPDGRRENLAVVLSCLCTQRKEKGNLKMKQSGRYLGLFWKPSQSKNQKKKKGKVANFKIMGHFSLQQVNLPLPILSIQICNVGFLDLLKTLIWFQSFYKSKHCFKGFWEKYFKIIHEWLFLLSFFKSWTWVTFYFLWIIRILSSMQISSVGFLLYWGIHSFRFYESPKDFCLLFLVERA